MPRRHRGIFAAIAGLAAIVLALGVGAYFGALYSPGHKQYEAVGSSDRTTNAYEGVTRSLPDVAGVPGPVERAIANPAPDTGEDHEQRDLAAQESMSVWGFYMAFFAGLTALITGFGTYFIAVQVRLTKEAVKDTGEATAAMVESNRIAENAQRPWIKISAELLGIELTERRVIDLWWKVTFTNVGGMVAENFQPRVQFKAVGLDFLDQIEAVMDSFPGNLEAIDSVLIPNDENGWHGLTGQSIEFLPWINKPGHRKDCHLLLIAMARYRIPGQERWRLSMQGFVMAEDISHIDDAAFRYDFPEGLSLDSMHIRKFGRSRAT